jgi:hypothetical protein
VFSFCHFIFSLKSFFVGNGANYQLTISNGVVSKLIMKFHDQLAYIAHCSLFIANCSLFIPYQLKRTDGAAFSRATFVWYKS